MHVTAAKTLARDFFYHEFLPSRLPASLARGGSYLVLLGDNDDEIRLLKDLGVPASRIYSVERDPQIYASQSRRRSRTQLESVLYCGELGEFITHYLANNQRFVVMNLDIFGAYKTSIEPYMTPILQFARRNPRTVIATYSNAGRDRPQLYEGLKALAWCLWLRPGATRSAMADLFWRYAAAGLDEAVCINMVLRHAFWLRSHLSHIIAGALENSRRQAPPVPHPGALFDDYWDAVKSSLPDPLSFSDLAAVSASCKLRPTTHPRLDIGLGSLSLVTYESSNHMYHTGWFAVYQPVAPQSAAVWLEASLASITAEPLRFSDRSAESLKLFGAVSAPLPDDLTIWQNGNKHSRRRRHPRTHTPQPADSSTTAAVTRPEPSRPAQPAKLLTAAQIERIRTLARQQPPVDTNHVVRSLRLEKYNKGSVTAQIALARRQA